MKRLKRVNKLDELGTIELAANLVGLDPWADDFDEGKVVDLIDEKFGVDMDTFHELASALARFTVRTESPLTKTVYQGFAKDGVYIAKIEAE